MTAFLLAAAAIGGCGGSTKLLHSTSATAPATTAATNPAASQPAPSPPAVVNTSHQKLNFPEIATKNTTRVPDSSPIDNAAAVALAVFPSVIPGTHPTAVTLAPATDWQASVAAASLMSGPFRAPLLLSRPGSLPAVTRRTLNALAPTGAHSLSGVQLIRVGNVAAPSGLRSVQLPGNDPYTLAAVIDRFEARLLKKPAVNVVIASATHAAFAMPAAGWAAESGDPVLYVNSKSVPAATAQALVSHHHPHIYVLGPPSIISGSIVGQLRHYGTVKRVSGSDPAANSVAFAAYRDPACPTGAPCGHVPHSFGWAIRSPGHGYVLMNESDPLNAAAAAALSSSGDYGPQLLVSNPNTLPKSVLNYFLDYATPGFTSQGPTAAVYNHGWLIGNQNAISMGVQAQVDSLLEAVPQR